MKTKRVKLYTCWNCKINHIQKWYRIEELRKVEETETHTDYKCPKCDRVVICENKVKV